MTSIQYRGQRIAVEEIEESGGHFDDLHDYNDTLLRGEDGNYYLRQVRMLKMSPNAEYACAEAEAALNEELRASRGRVAPLSAAEMQPLRAFRLRHVRPRVTIKRVTEKTALLWCVHQMFNSDHLKARLRRAIIKGVE